MGAVQRRGPRTQKGNIKGKGEGMKLFKKLATTFVACALAVATTVPAFADDQANASVIDTSKKTTLTIHKLLKGDSFSSDQRDDGTLQNVPGTPVEGVTFTAYKIDTTGKSAPAKDFTYNAGDNKITSNGVEYSLGAGTDMKTNNEGAATQQLSQGYYLVVETGIEGAKVNGETVSITETCAPFIVRLPMTMPNSTEWNYDVHVYPKNSTSTATKTPSKTSVNVGEALSWDIKTTIPSGIAGFQKFDVTDQLDNALTYTDGSAVVKVAGAIGGFTDFPNTDQDKGAYYTVSCAGGKLTVSFTAEGRKALAQYKDIMVTFGTTVNGNVLDASHQNVLKNTATVEFKNQDGTVGSVPTPETKVHTGKIDIIKKSSADQTMLNGVKFKIASSESNAAAGKYLKKDDNGTILDVNDDGYANANDYVATTENGKASFAGLKDYDETNTVKTYRSYYIVETEAAAGYELLDAPVRVDFTEQNSTEGTHYTISKDIMNAPKTNLPLTGGMGTVFFSVAGIALLGGAIALLVVRNRKSAKNA